MERFKNNQRIKIVEAEDGQLVGMTGTVKRLRFADDAAWVQMDSDLPAEHQSFPTGDERSRNLLLYPECCVAV